MLSVLNLSALPAYISEGVNAADLIPAAISGVSFLLAYKFRSNIIGKHGLYMRSLFVIMKYELYMTGFLGLISGFFSFISAFTSYYYPFAVDPGYGLFCFVFVILLLKGNGIKAKTTKDIKAAFVSRIDSNEPINEPIDDMNGSERITDLSEEQEINR